MEFEHIGWQSKENMMTSGRNCDSCESDLNENDYTEYGSWSYVCHGCGFTYNHHSKLSPREQVDKFLDDGLEADEDDGE